MYMSTRAYYWSCNVCVCVCVYVCTMFVHARGGRRVAEVSKA